MADNNKKLHIAMFPWLAFGHIIPYLELSKLIALKGHQVTFICTPRNIDRLPNLPPNLASMIKFLKLSLPDEENLPPNAEATIDVPLDKVQYLKKAYDGLQQALASFLEASRPDWIFYDFAPYWLPPVATKLGVSCAYFNIINIWTLCIFGSSSAAMINGDDLAKMEDLVLPPRWVPFPTNLAYRLYQAKKVFRGVKHDASGVSDWYRLGSILLGCDLIVGRSCMEIESDWISLLRKLHQKPVIPVGLLPLSWKNSTGDEGDDKWLTISQWLDTHNKNSVVYVALGSEVPLSQEDLTELAFGIELSGLPFFWALRKQHGSLELPDGFEDRAKGHGVVWTSWAPQLRILGHQSVGGFLTHCGWGSIIEGLQFGRPFVMLPFLLDQGLNARVFEEKKVGVEIPRNEQDGSFTRDSVAESLRLVMFNDGENVFMDNAKKMQKLFGDKELHDRYLDDFVKYLENHKIHKCE